MDKDKKITTAKFFFFIFLFLNFLLFPLLLILDKSGILWKNSDGLYDYAENLFGTNDLMTTIITLIIWIVPLATAYIIPLFFKKNKIKLIFSTSSFFILFGMIFFLLAIVLNISEGFNNINSNFLSGIDILIFLLFIPLLVLIYFYFLYILKFSKLNKKDEKSKEIRKKVFNNQKNKSKNSNIKDINSLKERAFVLKENVDKILYDDINSENFTNNFDSSKKQNIKPIPPKEIIQNNSNDNDNIDSVLDQINEEPSKNFQSIENYQNDNEINNDKNIIQETSKTNSIIDNEILDEIEKLKIYIPRSNRYENFDSRELKEKIFYKNIKKRPHSKEELEKIKNEYNNSVQIGDIDLIWQLTKKRKDELKSTNDDKIKNKFLKDKNRKLEDNTEKINLDQTQDIDFQNQTKEQKIQNLNNNLENNNSNTFNNINNNDITRNNNNYNN